MSRRNTGGQGGTVMEGEGREWKAYTNILTLNSKDREAVKTHLASSGIRHSLHSVKPLTLASFGFRKASYMAAGPNPVRDFTAALWVSVLRHCMNTENARDLSWSMWRERSWESLASSKILSREIIWSRSNNYINTPREKGYLQQESYINWVEVSSIRIEELTKHEW